MASKLKTRVDLLRLKACKRKEEEREGCKHACGRYMLMQHVDSTCQL